MKNLFDFIYTYKLFAVTIVIFFEYACFPISSEIVLPFSGAVCAVGNVPFLFIFILSVAAGVCGTLVCYVVGRYGGSLILNYLMRKFPSSRKGIQTSIEKFEYLGGMSVFLARMIPLCRTYIAFIAGAAKLPVKTYIIYSAFGIAVWNCVLIGVGYLLGNNWHIAAEFYSCYKNIIIPVAILLFIVIFFIVKNKSALRKGKN